MPAIRNFMLLFGTISLTFAAITAFVLRIGFDADADVFRTGWFIEFTVAEIAVLMVLRTNRMFLRSRPSRLLLATSTALAAVTVALPYTPLAKPLGLAPLSGPVLGAVAAVIVAYILTNELVKRFFPPDRQ